MFSNTMMQTEVFDGMDGKYIGVARGNQKVYV